jgi:hypothetical protein
MSKMNSLSQEKPAPSMVADSLVENHRSPAAPASNDDANAIMETVLMRGDLSKLTPAERNGYYMATCRSLGLNPLTRPFEYITLNGKMTLYAKRDAADQLRKNNGISIEIVSREMIDDLLSVHVRAIDATGRKDEDYGVVNMGSLRGEARANAILKAITKAKRRVTLSIAGLGMLDETEVADIPAHAKLGPTAITENGWPAGALGHEDEYADGTPNKQTKPPEQKIYSRNPAWVKLQTELDDMINAGAGPVEIYEWGSRIEHGIRNWPAEPKRQWLSYVHDRVQAVVGNTIEREGELVIDDEPKPEPAPEAPEPGPISQRAVAMRAQRNE